MKLESKYLEEQRQIRMKLKEVKKMADSRKGKSV